MKFRDKQALEKFKTIHDVRRSVDRLTEAWAEQQEPTEEQRSHYNRQERRTLKKLQKKRK